MPLLHSERYKVYGCLLNPYWTLKIICRFEQHCLPVQCQRAVEMSCFCLFELTDIVWPATFKVTLRVSREIFVFTFIQFCYQLLKAHKFLSASDVLQVFLLFPVIGNIKSGLCRQKKVFVNKNTVDDHVIYLH